VRPKRTLAALMLVLASLASLTTAAGAQVGSEPPEPECSRPGLDDKCEAWAAIFDDEEFTDSSESPQDLAVSPDGRRVYAAQTSSRVSATSDIYAQSIVTAHDSDGDLIWATKGGPSEEYTIATSVEVTPNGKIVFVSGTTRPDFFGPGGKLVTRALDAATGSLLWESTFDSPGGTDNAREMAVSPDGRSLYIAVISAGKDGGDHDYVVLEYDSATGAEQWSVRWDGIGQNRRDSPFDFQVNRRGTMAYVTGESIGQGNEFNIDYGTIAVHTKGQDEGTIAWTARYDRNPSVNSQDPACCLAISRDDSKVFVTGAANDTPTGPPFAVDYGTETVAYDAMTGQQLWVVRKEWPGATWPPPQAIAVDHGGRVIVTGQLSGSQLDFGTVAYDPATGQEIWSEAYGVPEYDFELAKAIVADPHANVVYVTGISGKSPPFVGTRVNGVPVGVTVPINPPDDQLTIAYDSATGEKLWLARYNPGGSDYMAGTLNEITRDGSMLITGGHFNSGRPDGPSGSQTALVSYDLGAGNPVNPMQASRLSFTENNDTEGQYSDAATLEARLTNSFGDPIDDAPVTFTFGPHSYSATTDVNGVARLNRTLTEAPGNHLVEVSYEGIEAVYTSASATETFTVAKEQSRLSVQLRGAKARRQLRARLVDGDSSSLLEFRTVVFYVKNKRIGRASTAGTGVAALKVPARYRTGKWAFNARFLGDDYYRPDRASL
jgi:PQQ-like domain